MKVPTVYENGLGPQAQKMRGVKQQRADSPPTADGRTGNARKRPASELEPRASKDERFRGCGY